MFSGFPSVPSSLVEASAWNPIEVPGRGSRMRRRHPDDFAIARNLRLLRQEFP